MIEDFELTPANFRRLRMLAGVSQAEAARWMGAARSSLCNFERRGSADIATWRLYRCADWLAGRIGEITEMMKLAELEEMRMQRVTCEITLQITAKGMTEREVENIILDTIRRRVNPEREDAGLVRVGVRQAARVNLGLLAAPAGVKLTRGNANGDPGSLMTVL